MFRPVIGLHQVGVQLHFKQKIISPYPDINLVEERLAAEKGFCSMDLVRCYLNTCPHIHGF
jgi:hypothetical protein